MKSSSFHTISADKQGFLYKLMTRLLYFPFNWINNLRPLKIIDPDLKITQFKLLDVEYKYSLIEKIASPSRKLSNLFWMNYDWKALQNTLGDINICDLGCGSGKYYELLQEYSNNNIGKYTGLDIYENKNWEKLKVQNDNVGFIKYDGKNILDLIPKETNLIISQSAIEHFTEDITIFKQVSEFVKNSEHPVYQIHLFPAASGLKMFRYHGIRQYTPRNISKITNLFSGFSNYSLLALGADDSVKIHRKYITKPSRTGRDLRHLKEEKYNKECLNAIKKDMAKTLIVNDAAFYALIIKKG